MICGLSPIQGLGGHHCVVAHSAPVQPVELEAGLVFAPLVASAGGKAPRFAGYYPWKSGNTASPAYCCQSLQLEGYYRSGFGSRCRLHSQIRSA